MDIEFCGGAGEVGRNSVLVDNKILLDCGIKLGEKEEYPNIEADPKVAVITHAHLDHAAYLPFLFNRGLRPRVYLTKPTRDLMQVLIGDYMRINEQRAFKQRDAINTLKACEMKEYHEKFKDILDFEFFHAGHILGSAMIKTGDLLYTGDINCRETKVLEPAERGIAAKYLVMESTYGAYEDKIPAEKTAGKELCDKIKKTIDSHGWVIIPVFGVGRAQEIMMIIQDYAKSGYLPEAPMFIDGMISKVSRIYRHNALYMNETIKKRILASEEDPFKSDLFMIPKAKDKSDVLEHKGGIIITTSGMLSGGPVLKYLEKLGDDKNNSLILVGYQAEGTRGRKLLNGEHKLMTREGEIDVNLRVEYINFSAHADHEQLVGFAKSVRGLKKVFLMHGEPKKTEELAQHLQKFGMNVEIPKNGEYFTLV